METTTTYDVVLIPAEEGGYTVIVPSLPGCISEGDTEAEALENIKDAIHGWLSVAEERGLDMPPPDAHRLKLVTVGVTE
jgi:antitoxin HicB